MSDQRSRKFIKAEDVNAELGIVFGRAMVCTTGGEPYFDTDNQHIPPDVMLKAAVEWSTDFETTGEMHTRESGDGIFMFPLTKEIAAAFQIEADWEGLMVGYKPEPDVLAKFISGEYTGFSAGGDILDWEDVD